MSERWVLCGEVHSLGCRPAQTRCSCLSRTNGNREQGVRHTSQADAERKKGHKPELHIIAASSLQQYQRHDVSVWHPCVPCHCSRCGKRQHIKPCVIQLTAWEHQFHLLLKTTQQLDPSLNFTWLNTASDSRHSHKLKLFLKTFVHTHIALLNVIFWGLLMQLKKKKKQKKHFLSKYKKCFFCPDINSYTKKIKLRQLSRHFESFASSKDVNKFKF